MKNLDLVYFLKTYSGPQDEIVFLVVMAPIFIGIISFLFMRVFERFWWDTLAKIFRGIWITAAGYYVFLFFWVAWVVLKAFLYQK